MDRKIDVLDPRGRRMVEHDDIDLVSVLGKTATKRKHRRSHAADARIERMNQLQDLQ